MLLMFKNMGQEVELGEE